jgi:mycofactocin glycosyltransferase
MIPPRGHSAVNLGACSVPKHLSADKLPPVDVIIPVYKERPNALAATLFACLGQSYPISRVFVVDDGSPDPVCLPDLGQFSSKVILMRLPENQGISAARNSGIARSKSPLLACINSEVLPQSEWLSTCADYLSKHKDVGVCYTQTVPDKPSRLLTRWRMRFQEPKWPETSGPALFAHGHAVLFRREALYSVGGYDVRYRLNHEDSDICMRMRKMGWETHFVAQSRCISIQRDSFRDLALKQLRDSGWSSPVENSYSGLCLHLTKWTLIRAGRNIVNGRLYFLPIDAALWASALSIAAARTVQARLWWKQ